jgi:hypothetical protein
MTSASRAPVAIAVSLIAIAISGATAHAKAVPPAVPSITITSPEEGARTNKRTAVVTGEAPVTPRGGEVAITVSVNGRPVDIDAHGGRFRVTVVLELGVNRISANAEVYGPDDDLDPVTAASAAVQITRVRGPDTGVLNLATALWVADKSSEVYWLCGETADYCPARPVCVRLSSSRIDCPVESQYATEPRICGVVISVHLRGRRVYSYPYRCGGRWHRNSRDFVRPDIQRKGRRYRVNEREADWFIEEINEPNRYGIPRFDVVRDLFIP